MPSVTSPSSVKYRASKLATHTEVENGIALLDMESNTYFMLNNSGAIVWRSLDKPRSIDELAQEVAKAYGISTEACKGDVGAIVEQLIARGLVIKDAQLSQ